MWDNPILGDLNLVSPANLEEPLSYSLIEPNSTKHYPLTAMLKFYNVILFSFNFFQIFVLYVLYVSIFCVFTFLCSYLCFIFLYNLLNIFFLIFTLIALEMLTIDCSAKLPRYASVSCHSLVSIASLNRLVRSTQHSLRS